MPALSRRHFLRTLGVGAAAGTALRFIPEPAFAFEPRRTAADTGAILLNSNENAYGPTAKVMAALEQAVSKANRYPDFQYEEFTSAVAKLHGVDRAQVLTGCGSTEILHMSALAFTGPGKRLVMASPTFEAVGHYARNVGADIVGVPLTSNYEHDLDAMLKHADAACGLVYICNPNNPTGSITPRKRLDEFIASLPENVAVLIDEAYHHFADSPDYSSYLENKNSDSRIIVARTFSKVYGMAGIRVGYGIANGATLEKLKKYQTADDLNVLAAHAASVGLADTTGTQAAIARNARDRANFMAEAKKRSLHAIPSQANFVMLDSGRPVRQVIDYFHGKQILVGRPFPPLDTHVRVSLGTPEQMTAFWRAWDAMPSA